MKEPLFIFERSGEIARDCVLENHLWVDVGNRDDVGVFDHHQKGGLRSSFEAVLTRTKNYEGLKHYLSEHTDEETQVTFHVHTYPDLDCIFSVYVIRQKELTSLAIEVNQMNDSINQLVAENAVLDAKILHQKESDRIDYEAIQVLGMVHQDETEIYSIYAPNPRPYERKTVISAAGR